MVRTALILAITVILFLAPRLTVGETPTADAAAAQPATDSPAALSAAAGNTSAAPPGEPSFFSWAYWQEGGTSTSRSEVARNFLLALAAFIGLGFGIWRAVTGYMQARASQRQAEAANEQARIAQQGQITDRFSTAVEHLGSAQLPVRLGGIYALWRLIKDSPERDVTSVVDILCAFVRNPPHEIAEGSDPSASAAGSTTKIRPDVQTILNLIGPEKAAYRALLPDGYRLDLTGANLAGANLSETNLTGADLWSANLTGANLWKTNLTDAGLASANLTNAMLTSANLIRAHLRDANLTDADLWNANFTDADLTGADLTGTDLAITNVTQEQLDAACISKGGKPPTLSGGLKPPQKECVR